MRSACLPIFLALTLSVILPVLFSSHFTKQINQLVTASHEATGFRRYTSCRSQLKMVSSFKKRFWNRSKTEQAENTQANQTHPQTQPNENQKSKKARKQNEPPASSLRDQSCRSIKISPWEVLFSPLSPPLFSSSSSSNPSFSVTRTAAIRST